MRYKPERALTHFITDICDNSKCLNVEMRYKPERALTLLKSIFIVKIDEYGRNEV